MVLQGYLYRQNGTQLQISHQARSLSGWCTPFWQVKGWGKYTFIASQCETEPTGVLCSELNLVLYDQLTAAQEPSHPLDSDTSLYFLPETYHPAVSHFHLSSHLDESSGTNRTWQDSGAHVRLNGYVDPSRDHDGESQRCDEAFVSLELTRRSS